MAYESCDKLLYAILISTTKKYSSHFRIPESYQRKTSTETKQTYSIVGQIQILYIKFTSY